MYEQVPTHISTLPDDSILKPWELWSDRREYDATLRKLAQGFRENFDVIQRQGHQYVGQEMVDRIMTGGPQLGN